MPWTELEKQNLLPKGRSKHACEWQLRVMRKKVASMAGDNKETPSPVKKPAQRSPKKRKVEVEEKSTSSDDDAK